MIIESFTDRLDKMDEVVICRVDARWLIKIAKAALVLSSKMIDTEEVVNGSDKSIFDVEEEWSNLTEAFMGE